MPNIKIKKLVQPLAPVVQSYKHFTLVNYDSRIVITIKLLIITTPES